MAGEGAPRAVPDPAPPAGSAAASGPLEEALALARAVVEGRLRAALGGRAGPVPAAMLYACEGGKGLRGLLVLEAARLHGVAGADAAPAAAAIEAMHAYSLVHDDLPCMDDDDLRRGRPTVHRAWDEATAVLAGDALQALAYELAAQAGAPPEARALLVLTLAQAAGEAGMVGGQAADIAAEAAAEPLGLDAIIALQSRKTGALLAWAAAAGARMAGADPAPLLRYGAALGLAFQIADDVLDVEGSAEEAGKATGKDGARNKATFVSHLGLEAAKARATSLAEEACAALDPYGAEADLMREAARFAASRRK